MLLPSAPYVQGQSGHLADHGRISTLFHQRYNITEYGATGDGTTDDTAATLAAVADCLANGGGEVYAPASAIRYKLTGEIVIPTLVRVTGDGQATKFGFAGTFTNGFRFLNATQSSMADCWVVVASGTVTNGILATTTTSFETGSFYNVYCSAEGGTLTNAWSIGGDTADDVAEITLHHCIGANATNAFKFGNGTGGNVLDHRAYGCVARNSVVGVLMDGAAVTWYGGSVLGNSTADFKLVTPPSQPIIVSGVRSEGSKKFWECLGGSTSATTSVLLENNVAREFTEATGLVVDHQSSIALTVIGGSYYNPPSGQQTAFKLGFDPANPLSFVAINVGVESNINPFKTNTTGNIDEAAFLHRTIIGCYRMDGTTGAVLAAPEWNNAPAPGPSRIVPPASMVSCAPTVWFSANYTLMNRFTVDRVTTIRYIDFEVGTQSGNIQLGIVRLSGAGHLTATRLVNSGIVACPAAGAVRYDIGATILAPGDYAVFLWCDNTTAAFYHAANTQQRAVRGSSSHNSGAGGFPAGATALADGWTTRVLGGFALEGDI